VYDEAWGGAVSCGCYFAPTSTSTSTAEEVQGQEGQGEEGQDQAGEEEGKCFNEVSGTDCPNLYDMGQNFGQGFFQDHHYHFGYHIYAAAVRLKKRSHGTHMLTYFQTTL
jgi:hypothetical protein